MWASHCEVQLLAPPGTEIPNPGVTVDVEESQDPAFPCSVVNVQLNEGSEWPARAHARVFVCLCAYVFVFVFVLVVLMPLTSILRDWLRCIFVRADVAPVCAASGELATQPWPRKRPDPR